MSSVITSATTACLADSGEEVPTRLYYNSADPYAVSAEFFDGVEWPIWTFARDLLDIGLISSEPMGVGDVAVWTDGAGTHLHIIGDGGCAELLLDEEDIEAFLCETYVAVPLGLEHEHADAGAELDELLRSL